MTNIKKNSQVSNINFEEIFNHYLKEVLPDFEPRKQQTLMAKEIFKALVENKKIIVEAPTGVGKSLAYLISVSIYMKEKNKNARAIVSTYTKTLQQQLLQKDLPIVKEFIKTLYDEELKYTVMYGSENYICLQRFQELKKENLTAEDIISIAQIQNWLSYTETGCIEELELEDLSIWDEINREPDLCRAKKCKFYEQCFYYKNIHKLKEVDVVVVNHHLFFANIFYSGKLLPKASKDFEDIVIFDEAHDLEDVILQWLGYNISNTQIKFLCKQIYNPNKSRGLITKLPSLSDNLKESIINSIMEINAASGQFFTELSLKIPKEKNEIRIFEPNIVEDVITPALSELLNKLKLARNQVDTDEEFFKINSFCKRIINFIGTISFWLKCEDTKNFIYWLEKEETKRKTPKITLRITPLEVANEMQQKVYSVYDKIVFTSATLCVNNQYEFFKSSVGLIPEIINGCTETKQVTLSSPFDFKNNVLLYLPENIPNPKEETETFKIAIINIISKLINLTKGNTFVLFTSFELMKWVYENIQTNFKILIQNTTKYKLLEQYKSTENSVLFGVDTFWQGVDIPGEKLISIIIPKLPFDVPDHPVVEAKAEKIDLEGGDSFKDYILPNAVIKLKQGFGRLIRRKTDWGIITILDPRIRTRWYGKYFLNSLPECSITMDFEKVVEFYKKRKTNQ